MKVLLLVLCLCVSSSSLGAGSWSGQVLELRASNVTSAILFRLSGELENPASCNQWKMYAVDLRLPGGEQVFELLKYAFLHKLPVKARSLGTCRTHWKSEGVKELYLIRS